MGLALVESKAKSYSFVRDDLSVNSTTKTRLNSSALRHLLVSREINLCNCSRSFLP